jgi:drug/metabolite transporter (DMT)-like permease
MGCCIQSFYPLLFVNLSSPTTRAYLCLAAICVIWSTTYTGIKYAIRDFPPFLMVSIRQTSAGLVMLAIAAASGKAHWPGRRYILRQSLTGLATITGGNGFVTWGMQFVSSGLSAVIGSLTPVMVLLINIVWRGTDRISPRMVVGVFLGFAGLGIIFHDGWADFLKPDYRWGIIACFGSCLTWSLGTVMAKKFNASQYSPIFNAGLQVTAGGLGALVMSILFDPNWQIHHTTEGWLSVAYLSLIGSALAFTIYLYALKHLSATVASLYTYINPIGAILLGWILLGESLNGWMAGGMLITIVGVWLVNSGANATE